MMPSQPSYTKLNYSLRPAKNIERKMLVETALRLARVAPVTMYRYVGFGSVFFNDFILVHQRLGIQDLICIERNREDEARFMQNLPYKCIRMQFGHSHEVLPQLSWKKRAIVWLDYDGMLDADKLDDIRTLCSSLLSGSFLAITVNAQPERLPPESKSTVQSVRLSALVDRVGSENVPTERDRDSRKMRPLQGSDLAQWGLAKVSHKIIRTAIADTLNDRNAPLSSVDRLKFRQLHHFRYADGAKMLTVSGILVGEDDRTRLGRDAFDGLDYIRPSSQPYSIKPPVLTSREMQILNARLPTGRGDLAKWLGRDEKREYRKVYRHYPAFAESEL